MTRLLALAGLLFLGTFNLAPCEAAQKMDQSTGAVGRWLTQSGNFEINIASCGQALCGTVVRVLGDKAMSPSDGAAKPVVATKDAMGLKILTDLTPSGEGTWEGHIYNREDGKTYDCRVSSATPGQLEVRAYKFLPIFGKTQVWTRVGAAKS